MLSDWCWRELLPWRTGVCVNSYVGVTSVGGNSYPGGLVLVWTLMREDWWFKKCSKSNSRLSWKPPKIHYVLKHFTLYKNCAHCNDEDMTLIMNDGYFRIFGVEKYSIQLSCIVVLVKPCVVKSGFENYSMVPK